MLTLAKHAVAVVVVAAASVPSPRSARTASTRLPVDLRSCRRCDVERRERKSPRRPAPDRTGKPSVQ
jgi:hypothetical protein